MNDEEVLDVRFDPNYCDRKVPRNVIRIQRSLDNHNNILIQFDYDGKEDDFIYMTVDIMDLMLALGKIFRRKIK
ncbi:hypothetical protein LCGC14_0784300 [marine sediment metagenome]|uniref:Uncharacterized protein n=1 Tax=marine sediment metagenome TaxID=412755 RepID=A0A0F9QEC5_9ZZZZ